MTEGQHPNYKDGIIAYRQYWNFWLYHCYKFNNINTLPSCSDSFHCQNSLGTYWVLKNNLNYLLCVSYGIIDGPTRISRISRILFRCKQRVFSFGLNGKTPKESVNPWDQWDPCEKTKNSARSQKFVKFERFVFKNLHQLSFSNLVLGLLQGADS